MNSDRVAIYAYFQCIKNFLITFLRVIYSSLSNYAFNVTKLLTREFNQTYNKQYVY
jgi:hypothetical protein